MSIVVPDNADLVRQLPSRDLYELELGLEQASGMVSGEIDARVVAWTRDGWSQRKIAEELGCSDMTVGRRLKRLDEEPMQPKKVQHPVALDQPADDDYSDFPTEILDAEVVEVELVNHQPAIRTVAGIGFPSGGITETGDLTAYNTKNLKTVSEDLIRRATRQESIALHKLFVKYAEMAERKANGTA